MKLYKLELSEGEIKTIALALRERPYKEVCALFVNIQAQVNKNIKEDNESAYPSEIVKDVKIGA